MTGPSLFSGSRAGSATAPVACHLSCNNPGVTTRLVGALCVALAWLCGAAALAQGTPAAAPGAAGPPLPVIQLAARIPEVDLDGKSKWWVDDSGSATIEQVAALGDALPWALKQEGRQYRIDGKAWWLRFDAVSQTPGRWFIELLSSGLDRAQLFYRDGGRWVVQEAGDTKPVSEWPLPGRVPAFDLSPEAGKPVRYWLRVEHARVDFAVPILLKHQGRLIASREREQFMLGAYFGLSALIALVSVGYAVAYRDRSFASYALYVGSLALGQAAYLGVGAQHLWSHALRWNEVATFVLPGISSACALWFVRTVTEPARFSRALDMTVWALILGLLSAVALDTWLTSRATFGLQMALTGLALVVVAVLIVTVWVQGDDPTIRIVALGFLPVMVMVVFPLLRSVNLIPNSALTRYGVAIGATLEMPILFYALTLRGMRRREAGLRAAALGTQDPLTGLANERTLQLRLETALARARSLKHPCALLCVRVANLEEIARTAGRDAIDRTLVLAASYLRRSTSDIDVAARVGERDFALLLEGPTSTAAALSRAQQVVAAGLRQAAALPADLLVKFHIAIALLPDRDLDGAASLRWVLDAVAEMPLEARKAIRPLNF